jgi:hypothetical protein
MSNGNEDFYNQINRLIGDNTVELPAEAIPNDVNKKKSNIFRFRPPIIRTT